MKLKILSIIVISILTAFGVEAQTHQTTGFNRTRTTTTTKKETAKTNAKPSPLASLETALSKKEEISINSLSDLNSELTWAKNFETQYCLKLKAGPKKTSDGKFVFSGSLRASDAIERYFDLKTSFANYIGSLPKYNRSNYSNGGISISNKFTNFLILQHINDILELLPESVAEDAFKTDMVSLFVCLNSFVSAAYEQITMNGGDIRSLELYDSSANATTDFLYEIWKIIKDSKNNYSSSPNDKLQRLKALLNITLANVETGNEDQKKSLKIFSSSANTFLENYSTWLSSYSGHSKDLDNAPSELFNTWFKIQESKLDKLVDVKKYMDEYEQSLRTYLYDWVTQKPSFPGGEQAMYKWIFDNVNKDILDQHNGSKSYFVEFVVDRLVSFTDVKIHMGKNTDLDAEVIRVFESMPKWQPGKKDGKSVSVRMEPLRFRF